MMTLSTFQFSILFICFAIVIDSVSSTAPLTKVAKSEKLNQFSGQYYVEILNEEETGRYEVRLDFESPPYVCSAIESHFASNSTGVNTASSYKKAFIGPDELVLTIAGTHIQTHIMRQNKKCGSYIVDRIHVPVSGPNVVKIVSLRRNYTAIDELYKNFPESTYDVMYAEFIDMIAPLEPVCNNEANGIWVRKDLANYPKTASEAARVFPAAPLRLPADDKYKPFERNLNISYFIPVQKNMSGGLMCALEVDLFEWVPCGCKWQVPVLPDLHHRQMKENVVVRMIGDSHGGTINKQLNSNFGISSGSLMKVFCEYFEEEDEEIRRLNATSGIHVMYLLNCGQHFAAGRETTLSEYSTAVESFFQRVNSQTASWKKDGIPTYVFWYETPPTPNRDDSWVRGFRDWRTTHRLFMYNKIANSLAKQYNIPVIPAFSSLLAISDRMCDDAHYTVPTGHSAITYRVANEWKRIVGLVDTSYSIRTIYVQF